MFIRKVSQFIEEKHLLGSGNKVLVALSGGADSVALLRVLLRLGYVCEAAHCNFHLRGEESVRDERFVRALAESLGVPLHVIHFDTNAYAASHNVSVEMAARELRYDWFAKLRQECGAKVVAVAHHRDDSVETFLLNLGARNRHQWLARHPPGEWRGSAPVTVCKSCGDFGLSFFVGTGLCDRQH